MVKTLETLRINNPVGRLFCGFRCVKFEVARSTPLICRSCGKFGHKHAECKSLNKICIGCGGKDHSCWDCPHKNNPSRDHCSNCHNHPTLGPKLVKGEIPRHKTSDFELCPLAIAMAKKISERTDFGNRSNE
jgi:hypothetical protein